MAMLKLDRDRPPAPSTNRRADILDAAARCFARLGFHQTSMQQICAEAGMSAGNLYRYFPSKEAIIAGIAERDRAEVGEHFASIDVSANFFSVLEGMAHHYFAERTDDQIGLCLEIATESRRNADVARIHQDFDAEVHARLITMLQAAAARGEVSKTADYNAIATMLMAIVDGVWNRRVANPSFEPRTLVPLFMDLVRHMLKPTPSEPS